MGIENIYKLKYETAPALLFIERRLSIYSDMKDIIENFSQDNRSSLLLRLIVLLKECRNEIDHYEVILGDMLDIIKLSAICENLRLSVYEAHEEKIVEKNNVSSDEYMGNSLDKNMLKNIYEDLKKSNPSPPNKENDVCDFAKNDTDKHVKSMSLVGVYRK